MWDVGFGLCYYQPSFLQHFAPNRGARFGSDITLPAFAQLASLRLNTTRALISLIDGTNQYILAEATQHFSLLSHSSRDGEDELWFGYAVLPRSQGLCGIALDTLHAQEDRVRPEPWKPSPLIINDVTQDPGFKDQPFVTSHSSLRFYAAIPITTKSGFNIGTLSVMDERPRAGLGDAEIDFLGDITVAIMAHLRTTRAKAGYRRSKKMIKGLGDFMGGRRSLDNWWLELGNNKPADAASASKSHSERSNITMEPEAVGLSTSPEATLPRVPATSPMSGNGDDQQPANLRRTSRTSTSDLQDSLLSYNLKQMFSHASIGTFGGDREESHKVLGQEQSMAERSRESIIPSGEEERLQASMGNAKSSEASPAGSLGQLSEKTSLERLGGEEKTCGVLGFCTGEEYSLAGDGASEVVPLTEAFLRKLLHRYPHGHVFNTGERDRVISSMKDPRRTVGDETKVKSGSSKKRTRNRKRTAEDAEAKTLLRMLPEACSIAFVPLWDSHRERWFAGCFVWTVQQTTPALIRAEELNFIAVFGNSVMTEVARLDAVAAHRAKSDFISSINHELRSPLHGILASVEFLQDTAVDLFQRNMIDTIERCGRTLLDTIKHVLDFAKINRFQRPKGNNNTDDSGPSHGLVRSGMPGLCVDMDIGLITEDVIDSVFVGHEFQGNSSLVVTDEVSGFPPEGLRRSGVTGSDGYTIPDQSGRKKERLDVIMDIGWRPDWAFSIQSGALRRVLMNLFGNALKYTDTGWVKVSLQSKDTGPTPSQQSIITISISDSGRGIAEEYLQGQLFTPFTQENPLNPGTGLGLSIVLQIVHSLGGKIDITSKQGAGTEVVVSLTLNQAPSGDRLPLDAKSENLIRRVRKVTNGLVLGLVGFEAHPEIPGRHAGDLKAEVEPSVSLQASFEAMATHWFDMKVAAPQSWKASPPDIYIANESENPVHSTSLNQLTSRSTNFKWNEDNLTFMLHMKELRLL
ncbi:hypothetical protein AJ80_08209 [Polytolypa hystricis UAMH7299]|uniref:histidine kinase n=1 Tax=Polytolypa hystricis (strain UAMH7299) TaxID=1447883 RepID=A0A2B7XBI3_POLH7|nr:hypothetical protein AJ80_08209 [Polytolypa hystricis UAMH7299]